VRDALAKPGSELEPRERHRDADRADHYRGQNERDVIGAQREADDQVVEAEC
jgi:hypothetical protein